MQEMSTTGSSNGGEEARARAEAGGGGKTKKRQEYGNLPSSSTAGPRREATEREPLAPSSSEETRGDRAPINGNSNVHGDGRSLGQGDDDELGAGRASYGDDLETLDRRRTEELKLIGEFDS